MPRRTLQNHDLLSRRDLKFRNPWRLAPLGVANSFPASNTGALMSIETREATARVGGQPLHMLLVPFPIVCFTGALLTDIAYWQTYEVMWERFSIWLLTAGLVMAGFAIIAGLIDFIFSRRIRAQRPAWIHVFGSIAVLTLSVLNVLVHGGDAYTAVVPMGLALSALVVLIMIFTNWSGRDIVIRERVGVRN